MDIFVDVLFIWCLLLVSGFILMVRNKTNPNWNSTKNFLVKYIYRQEYVIAVTIMVGVLYFIN